MADPSTFLLENGIDEKATEIFLACDAGVQEAVMARGDFADARNPSAALLGRIREAKKAGAAGQAPSGYSVEQFVTENELDERAIQTLMECSPHVQQVVMARGDLKDARNPSAALLGRIKEANQGGGSRGGGGFAKPAEVNRFILENNLDERAGESLKSESPQVQRAVIERGGLSETRNPSAVVLGRIRDAKAAGLGGFGGGCGGWGGPPMGMMMQMMSQMMSKGGWGKGCGKGSKGGGSQIDQFIAENFVDEEAAHELKSLSKSAQQAVMARGSLMDARNPSAALKGRIRAAKAGPY
jgi:hypothetical protein